jgi:hypothetical protein
MSDDDDAEEEEDEDEDEDDELSEEDEDLSEEDEDLSEEDEEQEGCPKVSKAAKFAIQMAAIAVELIDSKKLVQSEAFTVPGQGLLWWYHDGDRWHLPFVHTAQYAALKAVLARKKQAGLLDVVDSVTDAHVKKLLDAAAEVASTGTAKLSVFTENDVIAMRKKARMMMAFRGGVVDLSGVNPEVFRPIPSDVLLFSDEVADADCPSMEELLAIKTDELQRVLEALLGDAWVVFTDRLVDTLRCTPTKALFLVCSSARSTFKSALVATVLGAALPSARCPAPSISAFMIGPKYANNSYRFRFCLFRFCHRHSCRRCIHLRSRQQLHDAGGCQAELRRVAQHITGSHAGRATPAARGNGAIRRRLRGQ